MTCPPVRLAPSMLKQHSSSGSGRGFCMVISAASFRFPFGSPRICRAQPPLCVIWWWSHNKCNTRVLVPNSKYCRLLKVKYHAYYKVFSCLPRAVKLSQPYRSPDSLIRGTISEYVQFSVDWVFPYCHRLFMARRPALLIKKIQYGTIPENTCKMILKHLSQSSPKYIQSCRWTIWSVFWALLKGYSQLVG